MDLSMAQGRCIGCGLLAIRDNPYGRGPLFIEVTLERRVAGNVFHLSDGFGKNVAAEPVCIRGRVSFHDKLAPEWIPHFGPPQGDPRERNQKALRVLCECGCAKWRAYVPGVGPEKMLELSMFVDLERSRRKWERVLERDRRAFETTLAVQLDKDRKEWVKQLADQNSIEAGRQHKLMVWLTILAVAIAIAQVVVPLFGRPIAPITSGPQSAPSHP